MKKKGKGKKLKANLVVKKRERGSMSDEKKEGKFSTLDAHLQTI